MPLAEMVRESDIAFPPVLRDFVREKQHGTVGLFRPRRNRIGRCARVESSVVSVTSNC
jgi:hypothetical protein